METINYQGLGDDSVEQQRINRICKLLERVDRIPEELDAIHEKLCSARGFTRDEFVALVDRRTALFHERDRVEKELREAFGMRLEQQPSAVER